MFKRKEYSRTNNLKLKAKIVGLSIILLFFLIMISVILIRKMAQW